MNPGMTALFISKHDVQCRACFCNQGWLKIQCLMCSFKETAYSLLKTSYKEKYPFQEGNLLLDYFNVNCFFFAACLLCVW